KGEKEDEDEKRVHHFFAHFMHDKVKRDPTQHDARFMEEDAYFVIRGIDTPQASSVDGLALPHPQPGRQRAPRHRQSGYWSCLTATSTGRGDLRKAELRTSHHD